MPSTATASNFLDLNSLRSFTPASSPDELFLSYGPQSTANATESAAKDTSLSPSLGLQPSVPGSTSSAAHSPQHPLPTPVPQQQQQEESHPDLAKRAGACGVGYHSCKNLGQPSLCCPNSAVCSADYLGQVACCPLGAACTGTVGGGAHTKTKVVGGGGAYTVVTTTTTREGSKPTFSNGGFVIAGGSTVAILGNGQSAGTSLRPPWAFRPIVFVLSVPRLLWQTLANV